MPGLKFIIDGDDAPLRKKLADLQSLASKNGGSAIADAQQAAQAVKVESDSRLANIKAINDETAAIKAQNTEKLAKVKPNLTVTPTTDTTSTYVPKSSEPSVANLDQLKEQLSIVQNLKVQQNEFFEAGTIGAEEFKRNIDILIAKEGELTNAITLETTATEEQVAASKTKATAIQEQIGLIEKLEIELRKLQLIQPTLTDKVQLEKTNTDIQSYTQKIKQLNNVGKTGYDDLGNKIEQTVEKQDKFSAAISRATNLNNIGATVISRLSRQIIGLGVGMLSFAVGAKAFEILFAFFEKIISYVSGIDQLKANIEAFNEVNINAGKLAGQEAASLQILYKAATDVNNSMADRIKYAQQIKAEYPDSFANSKVQAILNGEEAASYEALSKQIIAQAQAKAVADKIAANGIIIANAQIQKTKINNANSNEVAAAKKNGVAYSTGEAADAVINTDISVADQIKASNDRAAFAKKEQDDIIASANKTNAFLTQFLGGTDKVANALSKSNKLIQNPLQNFDLIVKNASDKADLLNLQAALQAKMDALAPNDSQIAIYRSKILQLDKILKQYNPKPTDGNAQLSASKTLANEILSTQQKIDQLKSKFKDQGLGADDAEKAAIVTEFTQYRNEIAKTNKAYDDFVKKFGKKAVVSFNANPANKNNQLVKIDPNSLNPIQYAATQDLIAKQTVEKQKVTDDQLKDLYKEYQDYVLKYGTDTANQAFKGQLQGYTSYVDYIKGQIDRLNDVKNLETTNGQTADPTTVKLLDFYTTQLPKAQSEAANSYFTETFSNLTRILNATQTAASKRKEIEDQYQKDVETISKNYYGKDAQARLDIAKQNELIALEQTKTLAYQQTQVGLDAAKDLFDLTKVQLLAQLAKLKSDLKTDSAKSKDDPTKLTPAQRKQIQDAKNSTKGLIDDSNQTATDFNNIANYASATASGFSQVAQSLQDINPDLADSVSAAGELVGVLGNVGSLAASISTANIAGIITGVFSLVSSVVGFFNRGAASAKASAAEIQKYNDGLLDSVVKYNELLRQQARDQQDINDLTLVQLNQRKELLAIQQTQAQADFNAMLAQIQASGQQITGEHTEKYGGFLGIGKKTKVVQDLAGLSGADYDSLLKLYTEGKLDEQTKAWFEQLQNVKNEMDEIGVDAKSTLDQINKIATGTTADDIAKSIVDGFQAGKKTAADFADDFQSLMQNAAISVFESNYLSDKIAAFYQQFSDASNSDGGLTAAKIAILQSQYADIIGNASSAFGELQKVLGISLTTNSGTGLSGAIKGITADQADLLAGQFGGMRLAQLQTNVLLTNTNTSIAQQTQISMQGILYLEQIAANTLRTADNTNVLSNIDQSLTSINKNTKSANNTLTANGKG